MFSIWEKEAFQHFDIIIIGAGISGLSTAISLKQHSASLNIAVLERATIPLGASSRNAGFACYGSPTEFAYDLNTLGEDTAVRMVESRRKGLEILISRIGKHNLGYTAHHGHEILHQVDHPVLDQLESLNQLLSPLFGLPPYRLHDQKLHDFGFTKPAEHLIDIEGEAQLHPGKMMKSLLRLAQEMGISIFNGTLVKRWEYEGGHIHIHTQSNDHAFSFSAKQLIVCTNGFSQELIPDISLKAGRGQLLLTSEIPDLRLQGSFHYDEGYVYFRNYGKRVLIGGARNIDKEEETTTSFGSNPKIQEQLIKHLKTWIIPQTKFKIEHYWSGIMAFGDQKVPILKRENDHLILATCLNGMGVALGSQLGEDAAKLALGIN